MTRSFQVLAALASVATLGAGCNPPVCGPGTKQVQQANGDVRCLPADAPIGSGTIPCDVDGGSIILGGICQSRTICGQNTTPMMAPDGTINCVGTGGSGGCAPCTPPGAGKFCVTGNLYDFSTNAQVMAGGPSVHYALYEPTAFLGDPTTTPLAQIDDTKGCFTFPSVAVPASGLIAIGVTDTAGTLQLTAVGEQVASNQTYQMDVYQLKKSTVASWNQGAGLDYTTSGAYVGLYYDNPVPVSSNLSIAADTNPVAGVQIAIVGGSVTTPHYFDPSRDMIKAADTATSAVGGAIAPPPGGVVTFTANGGTCMTGPCKWEAHPGGSAPGAVFIDRFHNCNLSPMAATCQ